MKPCKITYSWLFLSLVLWDSVNALCSLKSTTSVQCEDLGDVRDIKTYHLLELSAPSSLKVLLPGYFRNFQSLVNLDLSNGTIEIVTRDSFAKLRKLKVLNLSGNRIKYFERDAFDGLEELTKLNLGNNFINKLPDALLNLKNLKSLDLSANPLNCDCSSLRLLDTLLKRNVQLSKNSLCAKPFSVSGTSILKASMKTICMFEKQNQEMQMDQAEENSVESSGEVFDDEEDKVLKSPDDLSDEDEIFLTTTELPITIITTNTSIEESSVTDAVVTSTTTSTTSTTTTTTTASTTIKADEDNNNTETPEDVISNSTDEDAVKEVELTTQATLDTTTIKLEEPKVIVNPEESIESEDIENHVLTRIVHREKEPVKTESPDLFLSKLNKMNRIVPEDEGSGAVEDDGSGSDDFIASRMPGVDFTRKIDEAPEESDNKTNVSTSTVKTTTGESFWWDISNNIGNFVDSFYSRKSTEKSNEVSSTTKSAEDDLKEEQFIRVIQSTVATIESSNPSLNVEAVDTSKVSLQNEATTTLGDQEATGATAMDNRMDMTLDSKESKQGMGSYIVLAVLLVILGVLIVTAACRGDLCRKKQKRRDIERGTELKDMQKSLLDHNARPKVQASNGTTMENVPLISSTAPLNEPKDRQKSYDVSNGTSRSNGTNLDTNDPIKPPRKLLNSEIEAPLNGLNPPMDDIDGPDSPCLHNGSLDNLDNGVGACDDEKLKKNLVGTQKVKITMQENPDSLPKTPIMITRLKDGENLVKTP